MAISTIAKLACANKKGFDAIETKEPDRVYFITDTQQIYFGSVKFGGSIEFVTEVPTSADPGTLYVVNGGNDGIYAADGDTVKCVAKGYATTIDENSTNDSAATAYAVYYFVNNAITTATNGMAKKPTYDAETRTITIPVKGDDDVVINLGKDLVVQNGTLVDGTGEDEGKQFLKLVLTSGDTVMIDLSKLIDVYTGGATDTATVVIEGNVIKVNVKISEAVGNMLRVDEAGGLYVAPTAVETESTLSGDVDKIPSSAAVKAYSDANLASAKAYTDGIIDVKTYYVE